MWLFCTSLALRENFEDTWLGPENEGVKRSFALTSFWKASVGEFFIIHSHIHSLYIHIYMQYKSLSSWGFSVGIWVYVCLSVCACVWVCIHFCMFCILKHIFSRQQISSKSTHATLCHLATCNFTCFCWELTYFCLSNTEVIKIPFHSHSESLSAWGRLSGKCLLYISLVKVLVGRKYAILYIKEHGCPRMRTLSLPTCDTPRFVQH